MINNHCIANDKEGGSEKVTPNVEGFIVDVKQTFKALPWRAVNWSISGLDKGVSKTPWYFAVFLQTFAVVIFVSCHFVAFHFNSTKK